MSGRRLIKIVIYLNTSLYSRASMVYINNEMFRNGGGECEYQTSLKVQSIMTLCGCIHSTLSYI